MKAILIFCILTFESFQQLAMEIQQKCSCSKISEQEKCELINCYWDDECLEDICQNKKQQKCYGECQWLDGKCIDYTLSCDDYSIQKSCDQQSYCGWSNQERCLKFENCSDFFVSEPNLCYTKGSDQCEPTSTITNGQYQCRNKLNVECETLTEKTICNNSQQSNIIKCGWKSSKNQCLPIKNIRNCEDVKDWYEMCDIYACIWLNNTCKTRDCSNFSAQTTCKYIPNYSYTQIYICVWTDDNCLSVEDSDQLPQNQCFENTKGGYMWINDGCESCQGYAYNLSIITITIILLIFG